MSEPLRALLVTHDFPPMAGGIARALGAIAAADPAITVSTGRAPGEADDAWDRSSPAHVHRVGLATSRLRTVVGLVRWSRAAGTIVRRLEPEFVWAGNLKPAGYVARWVAGRVGIPYGLLVYGLDVVRLRRQAACSRRRRMVARALLGDAAGTVAISRATAERFAALANDLGLPLAAGKVRVVPLGADPAVFRPDADPAPVATRFALAPGRWLLTVARLVPHKGIDTALEALSMLPGDVGYLIAGDGPDRPRLTALAGRLGLLGRVRFLGLVPDADLPGLYRAATIYLGLSREEREEVEGFGLSLVEAASSGRAVVAASSGGIPDAVADQRTGLLVPPGEPAAAAAALRILLDDPGRAEALGLAGRRMVESRLNWDRVVSDLQEAARAFSVARTLRGGR